MLFTFYHMTISGRNFNEGKEKKDSKQASVHLRVISQVQTLPESRVRGENTG